MLSILSRETSGASMETVMAVFPQHKAVPGQFNTRGEIIGVAPFPDATRGKMEIFSAHDAAEQFGEKDPFIILRNRQSGYQLKLLIALTCGIRTRNIIPSISATSTLQLEKYNLKIESAFHAAIHRWCFQQ